MPSVTAQLNSYRQAPRKARLVADLIRGKRVDEARAILSFATMRGGDAIKKLLDSAVANAKNLNIDKDDLIRCQKETGFNNERMLPIIDKAFSLGVNGK